MVINGWFIDVSGSSCYQHIFAQHFHEMIKRLGALEGDANENVAFNEGSRSASRCKREDGLQLDRRKEAPRDQDHGKVAFPKAFGGRMDRKLHA
jgi:hypothetical protein